MTRQLKINRSALRDLEHIERYIMKSGYPLNAAKFVERILRKCEAIAVAPMQGVAADSAYPGARIAGMERRVAILFRVTPRQVRIVAIAYGGRRL